MFTVVVFSHQMVNKDDKLPCPKDWVDCHRKSVMEKLRARKMVTQKEYQDMMPKNNILNADIIGPFTTGGNKTMDPRGDHVIANSIWSVLGYSRYVKNRRGFSFRRTCRITDLAKEDIKTVWEDFIAKIGKYGQDEPGDKILLEKERLVPLCGVCPPVSRDVDATNEDSSQAIPPPPRQNIAPEEAYPPDEEAANPPNEAAANPDDVPPHEEAANPPVEEAAGPDEPDDVPPHEEAANPPVEEAAVPDEGANPDEEANPDNGDAANDESPQVAPIKALAIIPVTEHRGQAGRIYSSHPGSSSKCVYPQSIFPIHLEHARRVAENPAKNGKAKPKYVEIRDSNWFVICQLLNIFGHAISTADECIQRNSLLLQSKEKWKKLKTQHKKLAELLYGQEGAETTKKARRCVLCQVQLRDISPGGYYCPLHREQLIHLGLLYPAYGDTMHDMHAPADDHNNPDFDVNPGLLYPAYGDTMHDMHAPADDHNNPDFDVNPDFEADFFPVQAGVPMEILNPPWADIARGQIGTEIIAPRLKRNLEGTILDEVIDGSIGTFSGSLEDEVPPPPNASQGNQDEVPPPPNASQGNPLRQEMRNPRKEMHRPQPRLGTHQMRVSPRKQIPQRSPEDPSQSSSSSSSQGNHPGGKQMRSLGQQIANKQLGKEMRIRNSSDSSQSSSSSSSSSQGNHPGVKQMRSLGQQIANKQLGKEMRIPNSSDSSQSSDRSSKSSE
jgi:hypothetical protein